MKIGIFTDAHYSPEILTCKNRYNSLSLEKIRAALSYFKLQKVDACFCLGDLTDHCKEVKTAKKCLNEIIELCAEAKKSYPIYVVPGNHDYICWNRNTFFEKVGSPCPPYSIVIGDKRFVFLDGNYDKKGRSFDSFRFKWYRAYVPNEQINWLKDELASSNEECVIVCHELIDPLGNRNHRLRNAIAVRRIIKKSKKVKLVLQGHYHKGAEHTVNSIHYITYSAMCMGTDNHYYILEL